MSAGCIENMGDLKEALGVEEPIAPLALPDAPVAKMQADPTTVVVGAPVRFTSEGTRDPQDLALTLVWEFGDGVIVGGPTARHSYAAPGEYVARLSATSAAGLRDEATLTIRVLAKDAAPTIAIRALDASGAPVSRILAGDEVRVDAVASDPEGAPLAFAWDMGDGTTSHSASLSHTYDAPGVYDITLRATDAAGQVATATARILVDGAWRAEGLFEPLGEATSETTFTVPATAREVEATLVFPAQLGLHDLEVVILDADGAEVAATRGAGEPGAQGDATRELVLTSQDLAGAKKGEWTARVVKEGGLEVAWTLELAVRV